MSVPPRLRKLWAERPQRQERVSAPGPNVTLKCRKLASCYGSSFFFGSLKVLMSTAVLQPHQLPQCPGWVRSCSTWATTPSPRLNSTQSSGVPALGAAFLSHVRGSVGDGPVGAFFFKLLGAHVQQPPSELLQRRRQCRRTAGIEHGFGFTSTDNLSITDPPNFGDVDTHEFVGECAAQPQPTRGARRTSWTRSSRGT